jgi:uncharacterized membrane protein (UPF0127 family)
MQVATFTITSLTSGAVLADKAVFASRFLHRMKGLLGTEGLEDGRALVLDPCTSIHTFFMKYSIDAIAVGDDGLVIAIYHAIRPFRLSRIHPGASRFVELPAGTAKRAGLINGDTLAFKENK